MPDRIQRKRTKGWRKPPNSVIVTRPRKWGNPYDVDKYGREEAIAKYREGILGQDLPARQKTRTGRQRPVGAARQESRLLVPT